MKNQILESFTNSIKNGASLGRVEAYSAISALLDSTDAPDLCADFLLTLNSRLPTVEELNGYLDFLSEKAVTCQLTDSRDYFDLCGTGGDGKNTINISTLSAFVLCAAGEKVAKHGNYAASSAIGSSNLLEALGVPLLPEENAAKACIESCGIVFLHAPFWHPALKSIAPVRKALKVRTVFNLMGPLLNPAKPAYQIVGAPDYKIAHLLSEVMASRNSASAFVTISDHGGYDEVSLTGRSSVFDGRSEAVIDVADFGTRQLQAEEIEGHSDMQSTSRTAENILTGKGTEAQKSVIAANVALALKLKYPGQALSAHYDRAISVLNTDRCQTLLQKLKKFKEDYS